MNQDLLFIHSMKQHKQRLRNSSNLYTNIGHSTLLTLCDTLVKWCTRIHKMEKVGQRRESSIVSKKPWCKSLTTHQHGDLLTMVFFSGDGWQMILECMPFGSRSSSRTWCTKEGNLYRHLVNPSVQPPFQMCGFSPDHCCQTCSDDLYNVYRLHQAVEY